MDFNLKKMRKKIRLAIVGSRSFGDYELLLRKIAEIYGEYEIECVVSGGAIGADSLGARYAAENGIPLVEHKPDWGRYGKAAGFIRNRYIIEDCTHCIAFWDGKSRGTKNDIDLCDEIGRPCEVVVFCRTV